MGCSSFALLAHRWSFVAALGIWATACGGTDPILDRADEIRSEESNASGGSTAAGTNQNGNRSTESATNNVQPGQPVQPAQPDQMTPGIPDEPEVGGGSEGGSTSSEGGAVLISGTVSVKEGQSGRIKIKGHLKDPRGQVHQPMGGDGIELDYPAQNRFSLPVNPGATVWIEAFLDLDGNGGPSFKEPQATTPQAIVANGNVDSVELILEVQAHRPEPTTPMGAPGQPIDAPPPPPPPDSP